MGKIKKFFSIASVIIIPIIFLVLFVVAFIAGMKDISASADGDYYDSFVGDTVQEKVWWALIDEGYSKIAAAAVMGNIEQESHFDSTAVNSIGASGLCQWLNGRKDNLVKYAESKGVEWTDEETQIEYLLGEIKEGGDSSKYATYQLSPNNGYQRSDWEDATNLDTATEAFEALFERSGGSALENRKSYAKKHYDEFKNKSRPQRKRGNGAEDESSTPGIKGYYTALCSGRTYTEYYQNDGGAWNWEYGCWISSQATIMSGFGSKYTPNQLPGWQGSAQQYTWEQYGKCKYERIYSVKAEDIKRYLQQGHAIHIRVEGRNLVTDNGTHYFTQHSLTLLDYKRENGKDMVYLHDPYKGDPTYGWTTLSTLASCLNWYEHVWQ